MRPDLADRPHQLQMAQTDGAEPDWFDQEIDELCDRVVSEFARIDREARDYESQVNADYLREKRAR